MSNPCISCRQEMRERREQYGSAFVCPSCGQTEWRIQVEIPWEDWGRPGLPNSPWELIKDLQIPGAKITLSVRKNSMRRGPEEGREG